ncbi:MAG TPA: hypothetical protein VK956_08900, partial [Verrucomicrobium sp.]|nr:hypothetical protein [Verrucomicrobium sp.]
MFAADMDVGVPSGLADEMRRDQRNFIVLHKKHPSPMRQLWERCRLGGPRTSPDFLLPSGSQGLHVKDARPVTAPRQVPHHRAAAVIASLTTVEGRAMAPETKESGGFKITRSAAVTPPITST